LRTRPFSKIATGIAVAFVLLAFAVLCLRASFPSNRHRELDVLSVHREGNTYYFRPTANTYDESVTLTTSRNFARDGFRHTHFLANRGGLPHFSFFDETQTQCENVVPPKNVQEYVDPSGLRRGMVSLNNDCVYAHYPPLADWVFGLLAVFGVHQLAAYRMVAIGLNCTLLIALYFWLRREVSERAALVTLVLTATLPAFIRWADSLFYHSMQYLLLIGGILSFTAYLRERSSKWLAITWLLYLLEALASYQLTLFFGIMLCGLLLADAPATILARVRLLLLQASAPLVALGLQLVMRVSLMGVSKTWENLHRTVHARVLDGVSLWLFKNLLIRIRGHLMRLDLVLFSIAVIVFVCIQARLSWKRPLTILGCLLIGGASFGLAFPGTTLLHYWMMYRHFMPFTIFLLALAAELFFLGVGKLETRLCHSEGLPLRPPKNRVRIAALCCSIPLLWTAQRNVLEIRKDLALSQMRMPLAVRNVATEYLDVLQWVENKYQSADGRLSLALDGIRVNTTNNRNLTHDLQSSGALHDEIWWSDPVTIRSIALLTEEPTLAALREQCAISLFNGVTFESLPKDVAVVTEPFTPNAHEPPAPTYRWLRWSLPKVAKTRALRLTCSDLRTPTPLHEVEIS